MIDQDYFLELIRIMLFFSIDRSLDYKKKKKKMFISTNDKQHFDGLADTPFHIQGDDPGKYPHFSTYLNSQWKLMLNRKCSRNLRRSSLSQNNGNNQHAWW